MLLFEGSEKPLGSLRRLFEFEAMVPSAETKTWERARMTRAKIETKTENCLAKIMIEILFVYFYWFVLFRFVLCYDFVKL